MCLYDDLKCQQLTVTLDASCKKADCGEDLFKGVFLLKTFWIVINIKPLSVIHHYLLLLYIFFPNIFVHVKINYYHTNFYYQIHYN